VACDPHRVPHRVQESRRGIANWSIAFVGHGRRQRTITEQQVFARVRELDAPTVRSAGHRDDRAKAAG
jgi:hypothetical protein